MVVGGFHLYFKRDAIEAVNGVEHKIWGTASTPSMGKDVPFSLLMGNTRFFASDRVNPELPDVPITLKQLQQLTHVPADGYQHIYWVDAKVIERLKPENLDLE